MGEMGRVVENTDHQKMKAIGRRIKLDGEPDSRKREEAILLSKIEDKERELDRHQAHIESLIRAEADQLLEIEMFR